MTDGTVTPSVVIGVGRAGISVLNAVEEAVAESDHPDGFHYIGLDTDAESLTRVPSDGVAITLEASPQWPAANQFPDLGRYPYLTPEMEISGVGTGRQRPVGRFKLDNGDTFHTAFETLREEITTHVDVGMPGGRCNLFLVHSFGGGTGSGTYPLVLGMLDRIAGALDTAVYTAGVGVASLLHSSSTSESTTFPGRLVHHQNSYAALRDLEQFERLDIDAGETREIQVFAPTPPTREDEWTDVESFVFDEPPFDNYWLIGVDEDRIGGGIGATVGPERYRQHLNRTIAHSLHALANNSCIKEWATNKPLTGTFDQAMVSVPHERVRTYCEMKTERVDIKERKAEIADDIAELEDRQERLRTLRADGEAAVEDAALRDDIDRRLAAVSNGADRDEAASESSGITDADVASLLDDVEAEWEVEGMLVATSELSARFDTDLRSTDRIRSLRRLRSAYGLISDDGRTDGVTNHTARASELVAAIRERIETTEAAVAEWDPGPVDALRDVAPPVVDALESRREAAERRLEALQEDLERATELRKRFAARSAAVREVANRKQRARERLADRIDETNRRIGELRDEYDRLDSRLTELVRQIDDYADDLTDPTLSERVAILPLKREKLAELDRQTLTSLDSMQAYVREGYVDENHARQALSDRIEFSRAWENYIIKSDFEKSRYSSTEYRQNYTKVNVDEMWILHGEDAGEVLSSVPTGTGANQQKRSGDTLQHLGNPYRIESVSFTRRGPVSRFKLYQVLDEYAENGELTGPSSPYDDWRRAFAYPEWYPYRLPPDTYAEASLPFPPELNPDCVDKPDLSEGELKNYIKTNGLDGYLWQGSTWDTYRATEADEEFAGWKETLVDKNIGFAPFHRATPSPDLKSQWLAGQAEWDDIVNAYRGNLADETGVKLRIEGYEDG